MKKAILGILFGLLMLVAWKSSAIANEGVVELQPVSGFEGRCFGVSVFEDRMYRILVTCRDLNVAYGSEENYYVLWAENEEGKIYRLGEIERGKLSTAVDQSFKKLLVTVESDSYPRKASEKRVLEGVVEAIPFAVGANTSSEGEIKREEAEIKLVTPTPAPLMSVKDKVQTKSGFSRVLGLIGRLVGLGILVLVVAGVILTIVTRRKEQ